MIKIDNSNIVGVSLGNTQFSKIYKGVDLYWSKTPSLIQVDIEFREGVISMAVNGVVYNEPTTIYVEYKSTVEWNATLSDGYEYAITNGTVIINEKKIYTIKAGNPLNEIWYRTEDNTPISLSYSIGMYITSYDNSNMNIDLISNEYDSNSGYCKLKVDKDIVYWNPRNTTGYSLFYNKNIKSIDYIPETIESIGKYFITTSSINKLEFLKIGDLPNLKSIDERFYYNSFATNYGNSNQTISNFELGNMNQLESIGDYFIYVYSSSNYTINKITINKIKIGNTPSLKTIGNYFIGVETGAGNYPEATLTIDSLELGDMSNVETIGSYFFGCKDTGGKGTPKLIINSFRLPSMPKLKSVGEGAFNGITVNSIYVPTDCYDLYCNLFSNVKSKFVKI